ncbi:MAG: site-2 protease family protein [Planctomycetota bacterium]
MLDSLLRSDVFPPFDATRVLILAAEASTWESWVTWLYNILLVVLGLGFVIFVHELGHFLAAKAFGVKCEKFYVGFDVPISIGPLRLPSKLAHFQWGETEYGIGIIPLGGYVKMLGQDDDPRRLKEEAERIRAADPNAAPGEPVRLRLDPRSYPAKPVLARMIIISAGVVMNLIFGVLMAALAFRIGVPYEPALIHAVLPGDPAWKAGIQAGDRIVRIGATNDEQLSFSDMSQKVLLAGIRDPKQPVSLTYERDGARSDLEIMGTTAHSLPDAKIKALRLGIVGARITKLSEKNAFDRYMRSSGLDLGAFQPGDVILGVNGKSLPIDPVSDVPLGYRFDSLVHPKLNETVTLQVRRTIDKRDQQVDVEHQPLPLRNFGIRFEVQGVAAIATGSPAERAGIQLGDKPIRFNGEPIEDSMTLPLIVAGLAGQSVTLDLQRGESEIVKLAWTVPQEFQLVHSISMPSPSGIELPGSGLTYKVTDRVQSVAPNSQAAKKGILAGDVIKQFQFLFRTDAQKDYHREVLTSKAFLEKTPVDASYSPQYFFELSQLLPIGLPIAVDLERGGKVESVEIAIEQHDQLHWPERGLAFLPLRKTYLADGLMPALSLGCAEVWRRLGDVFDFLSLLFQGKAFNAIGGPGSIAVQATDAASRGISPLLMFLTLLSANLAIVNFLPIPALDGGHMVFLTTEAILGRPVDEELQMKLTLGGVVGLLCLMAWAIFNDYIHLSRYFGG